MPLTITQPMAQVPSYAVLDKLAKQNDVTLKGDAQTGTFSHTFVEGSYEFKAAGLLGEFEGSGVEGNFAFENGQATVNITKKPFWLPEGMIKDKIGEGLQALEKELS